MVKQHHSYKEGENLKNSETCDVDSKICRICLEEDENHMISPCACLGHSKFVHEECLKIWIKVKFTSMDEAKCEVCKEKFQTKILKHVKCKTEKDEPEIVFKSIKLLIIGIIMFICSISGLIFLILFLDKGRFSMFFGISMLIFSPTLVFSTALLIRTIFKMCFEVVHEIILADYDIYSLQTSPDNVEPGSDG
ncbi:hypothetical protein SteCoe_25057 [Stentor coeruleus]|uniref:Uncharacterized protein n=1 Tax=Stentor coeruleus TaxID=5963 RepID=A0A1R2BG45_9CILI|nr:hypothetical protein SteCoe_25057 [Stentor coeruleus]